MPRALVEQAHPAAADGRQRRRDVRHPVSDVVHTLAPAGQEPLIDLAASGYRGRQPGPAMTGGQASQRREPCQKQ